MIPNIFVGQWDVRRYFHPTSKNIHYFVHAAYLIQKCLFFRWFNNFNEENNNENTIGYVAKRL